MNDVYALYVILSSEDNQLYIVSTKEKELILPCIKLAYPSKIKQETRYILRNFFTEDSYQFTEECSYNFLDIQEDNSLDYLRSINEFSEDNLYITYGGIAPLNKIKPQKYWTKLVFNTDYLGYTTNKSLNLVIDNVINKTIIS
jgi:hypothetical protein